VRGAARTAFALSLGPAVALGFARFAYALVLPAMRADLGWNYALSGALNTANALGYLLGATTAALVRGRPGVGRAFTLGLGVTVASLAALAALRAPWALMAVRAAAGAAGAWVFIHGATLTAHAAGAAGARAGRVLGLYFGGVGLGIATSGAALPFLLQRDAAWPRAWLLMALVGAAMAWIAGREAARQPEPPVPPPGGHARTPWRRLGFALAAYFLFGLGYIGTMTFLIAYLQQAGRSPAVVAAAWGLLGVGAAVTGRVWEVPLRRLPAGPALALILLTLTLGAATPLVSRATPWLLAAGLLFGVSFLAVISSITQLIRTLLPAPAWGHAIAASTVVFALGQTVGPWLAGGLADRAGGLTAALGASAAALLLAVPLALRQPSA
jgi:predicted MFS family arabinose efflux permease